MKQECKHKHKIDEFVYLANGRPVFQRKCSTCGKIIRTMRPVWNIMKTILILLMSVPNVFALSPTTQMNSLDLLDIILKEAQNLYEDKSRSMFGSDKKHTHFPVNKNTCLYMMIENNKINRNA